MMKEAEVIRKATDAAFFKPDCGKMYRMTYVVLEEKYFVVEDEDDGEEIHYNFDEVTENDKFYKLALID